MLAFTNPFPEWERKMKRREENKIIARRVAKKSIAELFGKDVDEIKGLSDL